MPISSCLSCGQRFSWPWEDAFYKFGFGDGDGNVQTAWVVAALQDAGYAVTHGYWNIHNDVIDSIQKDGIEQIPATARVGYDDPRTYLPKEIVRLLDRKLPASAELLP